jgi:hypothetical protein
VQSTRVILLAANDVDRHLGVLNHAHRAPDRTILLERSAFAADVHREQSAMLDVVVAIARTAVSIAATAALTRKEQGGTLSAVFLDTGRKHRVIALPDGDASPAAEKPIFPRAHGPPPCLSR